MTRARQLYKTITIGCFLLLLSSQQAHMSLTSVLQGRYKQQQMIHYVAVIFLHGGRPRRLLSTPVVGATSFIHDPRFTIHNGQEDQHMTTKCAFQSPARGRCCVFTRWRNLRRGQPFSSDYNARTQRFKLIGGS